MTLLLISAACFFIIGFFIANRFSMGDGSLFFLMIILSSMLSLILAFIVMLFVESVTYSKVKCNEFDYSVKKEIHISSDDKFIKDSDRFCVVHFSVENKDTLFVVSTLSDKGEIKNLDFYQDEIKFIMDDEFYPHITYEVFANNDWYAKGFHFRKDNAIVKSDCPFKFVKTGESITERREN